MLTLRRSITYALSRRTLTKRPELKPISFDAPTPIASRMVFSSVVFGFASFTGIMIASQGAMFLEKWNIFTPEDDDED
mgnify:CR=1 FL=1